MSSNENSLLLRIRGDAAGGKAAVAETRAAIASLRTSSSKDFAGMQTAATGALGSITSSMSGMAGQVPILGGAVNSLTNGLAAMSSGSVVAGSSIAAIAGPAGLIVTAFVGLTVATVSVAQGLFNLAQTAADFRGKMFDLSQQTGVAVETLSTLEIVAKTTGGSIDSIAQSLVIFQGHLDDAQDATSEMGIKFKELGISTENTEDAFRDALKVLSEMPEGFHQTNEAAELFGRRGGKQVLAMLKEMDGDLPGTTAKLRALGLVISNEDAKAADEFNDQLAILNFQFRSALGKEVIPAALVALERLSGLFQENARSISFMGEVLGSFSNTVLEGFLLKLQEVHFVLRSIEALAGVLDRFMGNVRLPGLTAGVQGGSPFEGAQSGAGAVARRIGGGSGRAGRRVDTSAADALRLEQQQEDVNNALIDSYNKLQDELKGVNTQTRAYAIEQEILNGKLKDATPLLQAEARENAKKADNADKQLQLQKQLHAFLVEQQEAVKGLTRAEAGHITRTEEFIAALEKEGAVLQERTKEVLRSSAATLQLAADTDRLRQALEDLSTAPPPPTLTGADGDSIAQQAGAVANAVAGIPPAMQGAIDVFGEFGQRMSDVFGLGREGAEIFGGMMTNAFGQLAQAVGESVRAFVLFGNSGIGVKKFTAVLISEIAKMAAVQAVWELAQGLAMLALNFFWPDPRLAASATAHFHAAAVYGGLAAVATAAGRAVAGGSFAETGGGGGSGAGGGNQGRNPSNAPATREVDRRGSSQQPTIVIHLSGEAAAAFDYKVVRAVVGNHRINGEIRKMTETGES